MAKLVGKLIHTKDGQYELHNGGGIFNLSWLLDKVYHADDYYIDIQITSEGRLLFKEKGNLSYTKPAKKTYELAVNGENIEEVLRRAVDKYIEVEIYAEALGENYGTKT